MTRACVQERLGRPATAAPLSANICSTRCEVRPQEISAERLSAGLEVLDAADGAGAGEQRLHFARVNLARDRTARVHGSAHQAEDDNEIAAMPGFGRSEERRVGKEWRCRGWPCA